MRLVVTAQPSYANCVRLAKLVTKDDVLCNLSESQLYVRLYVHFTSFHGNVLLLAHVGSSHAHCWDV